MAGDSASKNIDKVRFDELKEIARRRGLTKLKRPCGLPEESAGQSRQEEDQVVRGQTDLVGVALSGGGLRSACFGLGIVQAFFERGLWRFVDDLSTVSGAATSAAF